jgi:hypothetical protein
VGSRKEAAQALPHEVHHWPLAGGTSQVVWVTVLSRIKAKRSHLVQEEARKIRQYLRIYSDFLFFFESRIYGEFDTGHTAHVRKSEEYVTLKKFSKKKTVALRKNFCR